MPFAAGVLTGLAAAAFAIGFPIVFPLVGLTGAELVSSGYGLLAYGGGLAGIMISPMHLCLALTRVYFGAGWGGVYRRLVPAVLLLTAAAFVIVFLR